MKKKMSTKTTPPAGEAEECRRLIQEAMNKPGVAEFLRVYEAWQKFGPVFQSYDHFAYARQIVSISSSSGPVVRHIS